jgi:hypothetical protein
MATPQRPSLRAVAKHVMDLQGVVRQLQPLDYSRPGYYGNPAR